MPLEILDLPESVDVVAAHATELKTCVLRQTRIPQDRLLFSILFLGQLRVHLAQP